MHTCPHAACPRAAPSSPVGAPQLAGGGHESMCAQLAALQCSCSARLSIGCVCQHLLDPRVEPVGIEVHLEQLGLQRCSGGGAGGQRRGDQQWGRQLDQEERDGRVTPRRVELVEQALQAAVGCG